MDKKAVVIAGAGSTHTPGIIQSLLQKKNELPLRKLALYDIDEKRMHLVYDIMKQFIEQEAPDIEVVVTTDPEKAFTDVDFVFAQIRQGGLQMRRQDERIPLKYGCVGQETCGAGGSISYGIRSIPRRLRPRTLRQEIQSRRLDPQLFQPRRSCRRGHTSRV